MHDFPKHRFSQNPPPWWPESEAWPPVRRHGRSMRRHFFRRIAITLFFFILFLVVISILTVGLIGKLLGLINIPPGAYVYALPVAVILTVQFLIILILSFRALRRLTTPLGDLLEAAERIAGEDYSIRVAEKGPPELRSLARAFNTMASRLQDVNERRRAMLADVTHELRSPLTVIRGNVEGMLDGIYSPDEEHLRSILEETHLLSHLVDDLRTLALAESGSLQLKIEPTDLTVLIHETAAAFQTQAGATGVILDTNTCADLPLIDLDPERLRQVLSNLLTNALRYTPSGGVIRVSCALTAQDSQVELTVSDNGTGIRLEDLAHVFDRFYKAVDSGGMGLGLAIARRLIEAHGGKIRAESQPGQGTTICITLPIADQKTD